MLIDRKREKLLNAIIFFSRHTNKCGKTKLFKLLYFLDFEHFKKTGRSATGLEYSAWKMGPVPEDLHEEFDLPAEDFLRHISLDSCQTQRGIMIKVRPRKDFDPSHFTKRELELLRSLADEYQDHDAEQMIEEAHLPGMPWHQVYRVQGRKRAPIPYEYALPDDERELILQLASEHEEIVRNYTEGAAEPPTP